MPTLPYNLTTPPDALPPAVGRLADDIRTLWLETYARVYDETGDELKAELAAWGAVKREDMLRELGIKSADGRTFVMGWAMLFTDSDNLDLVGTYFDATTQLALDYYTNAPLFYEHDGAYGIVGKRTNSQLYPHGVWLEHELDPTSPHFDHIVAELNAGVLYYSSDSIWHFVNDGYNPEDSHLGLWYLAGCSLTQNPAEPALGPVTLAGTAHAIKTAQEERKASADIAHITESASSEETQLMETDLIAQVATMLGLPPETPNEDIIARIQSLLDTATKMDDMDEDELSASKDMALLNTFREALTVEGVAPSDDELIVMLQSALDSLAGTPEEAPSEADLSAQMNAVKSVAQLLKQSTKAVNNTLPHTTRPNPERGTKSRGFGNYISKKAAKTVLAEGVVHMASNNTRALKALGYNEGVNGGWLADREVSTELLEFFYAQAVIQQAGATIVPMPGIETLTYRKQLNGGTAYWAGEGQVNEDTTLQWGLVSLNLREAIGTAFVANRLLKNSSIDLEKAITEDLQKSISLLVDLSALRGTGGKPQGSTGREFNGILNIPAVEKKEMGTGNGKVPTIKDFVDAWGRIEDANVPSGGKWGIVCAPRVDRFLRNTTDTIGQLTADTRYTQGHPVHKTTQIPVNTQLGTSNDTTEIYFGAWDYLYMGIGQDIEFVVDYSVRRQERQVLIQAIMMADVCVSHPQAFQILTGVRV